MTTISNLKTISMKLLIIICSIFFGASAYAQHQKTLIGFQNIPWGSAIEIVKSKLPNSKINDDCGATKEFRELYKKNDVNCRSVSIENYNINGIDLSLKASFNHAGRLDRVVISKAYETDDFMKKCDESYKQLKLLLETRYGDSDIPNVIGDGIFPYKKYEIRVWLPLPTEIWIAKAYDIDEFYKKKGKESCQVKIQYTKRQSEAASKL